MRPARAVFAGPLTALAMLAASGCATTTTAGPGPIAANPDADPYENFNRNMFDFNLGLDKAVLEPAAKGYRAVTNEPIRGGVTNFFNNLGEPVTFANEVLQGKVPQAAGTVGRFLINTTVGIIGLFDPASSLGIQRTKEDFGQTLGLWGVQPGPYLVLPFLGSTNPRDLVGLPVDAAINPINYVEFDGDTATRLALAALNGLNQREAAIETVEGIRQQIDPYTTARRFYVRNRAALIGNSAPPPKETEKLPDYELDF